MRAPTGVCLSTETLELYHQVMGQSLSGCPDALNQHRYRITAPPSAFSSARRGVFRRTTRLFTRVHAAGRVVFEHCGTVPLPHGDGTVVHAVIRHAQPTPQCERDRSPRCAEAAWFGGFRIMLPAPWSALTLPGLKNTSDREIR